MLGPLGITQCRISGLWLSTTPSTVTGMREAEGGRQPVAAKPPSCAIYYNYYINDNNNDNDMYVRID